MSKPMTGGCLCGAIRYEVSAPIEKVVACHCTSCRRISGAGSSHNAIIPSAALKFVAGSPKRYHDTSAASGNLLFRHFCEQCGSSLYSQREKTPEMAVLKVGTLDDASGLKMAMNAWTDSALPWVYRDPALPAFAQNRPPS